jgi:3-deoxy-D-manno-octulosonic acid kinase
MVADPKVARAPRDEGAEIVPRRLSRGDEHILYDGNRLVSPASAFFDPVHWEQAGAITALGSGRGAAWMFAHEGREYVLRHYRRGGLVARLSADRYCWTGLERTRAWREWHLLASLHARGLPVPRPAAARVRRHGYTYRADLVTERIPDAQPLADLLVRSALPDERWARIGATIRELHDAGVCHADLNARNILLGGDGAVFLIDFDKAERRSLRRGWREANMARLLRSLEKLRATAVPFHFIATDWRCLLDAYQDSQGASASR